MLRLAIFALAVLLPLYPVAADDRQADAKQACRTLIENYAYYRDRFEAAEVAALFTERGTLIVPDGTLVGRADIARRLQQANVDGTAPLIRHFMSTVHIEVAPDGQTAQGVSYATIYHGPGAAAPQRPTSPAAVGEYRDKFELTKAGWRIAHREFVALWLPAAPLSD